jgi:hypothetical protein
MSSVAFAKRDGYSFRSVYRAAVAFFMGWAIEYEGLSHVKGAPLGSSHFLMWTLIPIFRIGVDLGPTIQSFKH